MSPDSTYVDHFARYASARTALGLAYYRAGAEDKAIATLGRSVGTSDGDDGFDWLILAMAYARRGDLAQARIWFNKAAQSRENLPDRIEWLERLRAEARGMLEVTKKDGPRSSPGS
jgi:tetratricopeptide (TPR) repeat protein